MGIFRGYYSRYDTVLDLGSSIFIFYWTWVCTHINGFTPIDTVELNIVLKSAAQYLRNFQIEYLTTSRSKGLQAMNPNFTVVIATFPVNKFPYNQIFYQNRGEYNGSRN